MHHAMPVTLPARLQADTTWFHVFRSFVFNGDCARLGPYATVVPLIVKAHTNFQTGCSFPSIETIVERSGISRRQVIKIHHQPGQRPPTLCALAVRPADRRGRGPAGPLAGGYSGAQRMVGFFDAWGSDKASTAWSAAAGYMGNTGKWVTRPAVAETDVLQTVMMTAAAEACMEAVNSDPSRSANELVQRNEAGGGYR